MVPLIYLTIKFLIYYFRKLTLKGFILNFIIMLAMEKSAII